MSRPRPGDEVFGAALEPAREIGEALAHAALDPRLGEAELRDLALLVTRATRQALELVRDLAALSLSLSSRLEAAGEPPRLLH